jgi:hypothetical protein
MIFFGIAGYINLQRDVLSNKSDIVELQTLNDTLKNSDTEIINRINTSSSILSERISDMSSSALERFRSAQEEIDNSLTQHSVDIQRLTTQIESIQFLLSEIRVELRRLQGFDYRDTQSNPDIPHPRREQ